MNSSATNAGARASARTNLKNRVLTPRNLTMVSATALMASFAPGVLGLAQAQETATENVTVSASRIIRDGFQAPTPTTVLGADDIANQAQPNIYAADRKSVV